MSVNTLNLSILKFMVLYTYIYLYILLTWEICLDNWKYVDEQLVYTWCVSQSWYQINWTSDGSVILKTSYVSIKYLSLCSNETISWTSLNSLPPYSFDYRSVLCFILATNIFQKCHGYWWFVLKHPDKNCLLIMPAWFGSNTYSLLAIWYKDEVPQHSFGAIHNNVHSHPQGGCTVYNMTLLYT